MKFSVLPVAGWLVCAGCVGKGGSGTGLPSEESTPSTFGPADVALTLHPGGVSLVLTHTTSTYTFGIVQAGVCGDECWVAESCIDEQDGASFCHPVGSSGVELDVVETAEDVAIGFTTRFSSAMGADNGYMLDDGTTCYVWGPGAFHYRDLDCISW